ncbi:hypothetical protein BC833DRAFT_598980 [Globomyces pollinis-pini]|nr:hypothetical protein BC833DRAFT_598980 [Globomyces pollinis-pini]
MKFSNILSIIILGQSAYGQSSCKKITTRKEVNDMTLKDWEVYQSTIAKAQTTTDKDYPGGLSIWEAAADFHNKISNEIHWSCVFLFWHRLFIKNVETKLQQINPDFFFPYFDSSRVWDKVDNSLVWKYLGTKGNPVDDPIFKKNKLKEGGNSRALQRDYTSLNGRVPSMEQYNQIYQQSLAGGGYPFYAKHMEAIHGVFHTQCGGNGGQMANMYSPLDPLFYMHHGHFDSMLVQAQAGWTTYGKSQVGGNTAKGETCTLNTKIPGYNNRIGDVLEVRNLCVHYALPGEKSNGASTNPADYPNGGLTPTGTRSAQATQTAGANPSNVPSYQYPPDYVHCNKCFPSLPESWLKMQQQGSKDTDLNEIAKLLDTTCNKIVEQVKTGYIVPPMPAYPAESRPVVSYNSTDSKYTPPTGPIDVQPNYSVATNGCAESSSFVVLALGLATFLL